ncbi:MAG: ferredoxin--NADP reductase [Bacteroidia bacterium]
MVQFHKLKVAKINRETKDAVSIQFEIPEELKSTFRYQPGQYLTVQVVQHDVKHRRAYSVCSSPAMGDPLTIGVKRVEDGVVSTYLNDHLHAGEMLEFYPPMGKFTIALDESFRRNFIMVAGGSGITPIISLVKSILTEEPQSRVWLFYGNRNEHSIMFKSQLEELEKRFDNFSLTHIVDMPQESWSGLTGQINHDMLRELLKQCTDMDLTREAEFFICGPTGMMEQVNATLREMHVPKEKIHIEYFTSPTPLADEIGEPEKTTSKAAPAEATSGLYDEEFPSDGPVNQVKVILNNETTIIQVDEDESILEAAMRQDLDPPYACQMGICTTCRARCKAGEVFMDEREGLTDQEVEEGFILTCQSHPKTPGVVVEYE